MEWRGIAAPEGCADRTGKGAQRRDVVAGGWTEGDWGGRSRAAEASWGGSGGETRVGGWGGSGEKVEGGGPGSDGEAEVEARDGRLVEFG